MAGYAAGATRLAALIRNFGLCPAAISQEERRAAVASVRSAYYRMAKEQHPDKAPEEERRAAADRFVRLNTDFEEAIQLLESGVRPLSGPPSWQPGAQAASAADFRSAEFRGTWRPATHSFVHREQPKFDIMTRLKGNLIFWSTLFLFFSGLREFLVWSAGSTYAWSAPSDVNPFWIRRFKDDWIDEVKQKREDKTTEKEKAKPKAPEKRHRNVDSFYQKRGISNVRRKTDPRGHGTSL